MHFSRLHYEKLALGARGRRGCMGWWCNQQAVYWKSDWKRRTRQIFLVSPIFFSSNVFRNPPERRFEIISEKIISRVSFETSKLRTFLPFLAGSKRFVFFVVVWGFLSVSRSGRLKLRPAFPRGSFTFRIRGAFSKIFCVWPWDYFPSFRKEFFPLQRGRQCLGHWSFLEIVCFKCNKIRGKLRTYTCQVEVEFGYFKHKLQAVLDDAIWATSYFRWFEFSGDIGDCNHWVGIHSPEEIKGEGFWKLEHLRV